MLIGYMRVSKADGSQALDLQRDALLAAGVDAGSLYEDMASGKRDDRQGLAACVKALRAGDTLVVWKLDRLGRDLRHLVNLVHDLAVRGVGLKVLTGTVGALQRYRGLRDFHVEATDETPFFVGTRGRRLGQALSLKQVQRIFAKLRGQLGWVNRGAHDGPRIHDLRHTFVVRRVMLWHAQDVDIDQAMLALSTYVGHAMVTNTYWCLTGVPELMALAAEKFESLPEMPEARHD
jgi:hypothetical protein